MTDTFRAGQVDGSDLMSEENSVFAVVRRRPDRETLATKGLWHLPGLAFETNIGLGRRYGANDLVAVRIMEPTKKEIYRNFRKYGASGRTFFVFVRDISI